MAYDLKNVFYLDTEASITKATAGSGTAQLDLSAYIDPIARGRTKGTGLAIYKAHFAVINTEDSNEFAPEDSESGIMTFALQAGLGAGDNATGVTALTKASYELTNNLLVAGGYFYGPASGQGVAGSNYSPSMSMYVEPSKEVPYVVVRDNVCLTYSVSTSATFESTSSLSVRLECAQVSLDQATLNQLLRTQTV
jgi:hypothetical protein